MIGGSGSENYSLLDDRDDKKFDDREKIRRDQVITSSLRKTRKHVAHEAGDFSMLRGLGSNGVLFATYLIVEGTTHWILSKALNFTKSPPLIRVIATYLSRLVIEQGDTAWLHIVISKPKHVFWYRRLPSNFLTIIKLMWMPLLALTIGHEVVDWISKWDLLSTSDKQVRYTSSTGTVLVPIGEGPIVHMGIWFIIWSCITHIARSFIAPALDVALITPIDAAHRRMQASLLPDEDEPIVPIDTSFDDGPRSGILAQRQPLPFVDALRGLLEKSRYLRLAKLQLKIHILKEVLYVLFWTLMLAEVTALVGLSPLRVLAKMVLGSPIVYEDLEGVSVFARGVFKHMVMNATVASTNATAAVTVTAAAKATSLLS